MQPETVAAKLLVSFDLLARFARWREHIQSGACGEMSIWKAGKVALFALIMVSIFADAHTVAATGGEAGAETAAGGRVGPDLLEEMLCSGRIGVITTRDLAPVAFTPTTRGIPPAVRRFVLHRDGGCTVAGCRSRYRLQPHHLVPFSHGGTHHPSNLATLCWHHHHVVIHRLGYRLADQRTLVGRTGRHRADQRQRRLALGEVVAEVLAEFLGRSLVVERIVDERASLQEVRNSVLKLRRRKYYSWRQFLDEAYWSVALE